MCEALASDPPYDVEQLLARYPESQVANDMQKDTVTVRDRDTMQQIRLPIDQLVPYIEKKIEF